MTNKTYNNITALLSFITTVGFVVLKLLDVITKSWWYIVVPWVLAVVFRVSDDEDDDNEKANNNNLKIA